MIFMGELDLRLLLCYFWFKVYLCVLGTDLLCDAQAFLKHYQI